MYDAIIVGGGASGLMCAIGASERGKKVLVIDSDIYPGKKLMVTGNGKCNLTNNNMSSKYYNQNIDKYLSRFNEIETINLFKKMGLVVYVDEEGRVYPYSRNARSVIDVLNAKLTKNKVCVNLSEKVLGINKKSNSYEVMTEKSTYVSKSIVVATGSFCNFLKINSFNISKKDFSPSLCALKSESMKKLAGTRLSDVEVVAECNGKKKTDRGEVLFKEDGLSGIVVFNLSSIFAREGSYKGKVSINLMPDHTRQEIRSMLKERVCDGKDLFKGWFAGEVATLILKKSKVDSFDDECIEKLVDTIMSLTFEINGFYPNHQVHSGGIKLSELNDNLESKDYKDLYFIGEIVDVDGECGGYNLQWAWTSGAIVGDVL